MSGVESMIKRAERDLGLREPNYIQDWYADRNGNAYNYNFPWCDAAITRWAYDSGNYDAVCFGDDYAYTVAHASRAKAEGGWHAGTKGIRRGDIAFIDWRYGNSISVIDHVGVVTGTSGSYVYMIEGNTANVCARRTRARSLVVGYIRPRYGKAGTSKPPASQRPTNPADPNGLAEDGQLGPLTAKRVQRELGVDQDGIWARITVRSLQRWVGAKDDGLLGPQTTRKVQSHVGAQVDGIWPSITRVYNSGLVVFNVSAESETTEKLQRSINEGTF